jgi:hypothetical protein
LSQITVLAYTLSNYHGPVNTVLRIYAPTSFIASDGTLVQGSTQTFYRQLTCTAAGTNLTIPQFVIDSTTDALNVQDRQLAGYSAYFYSTQGKMISVFSTFSFFKVPPTFNPTTWTQIALYSTPLPPLPIDLTSFYTKDQVDALIASGGGGGIPTTRRIDTGTGLSGGGDLSANRTHFISATGVVPGPYSYPSLNVNAQGQITTISSNPAGGSGTVTAVSALSGGGLVCSPSTITATGTVAINPLSPNPAGAFTNASLTVNSLGQVTAASSGSSPGPGGSDFELEQFGGAADWGSVNTDNLTAFNAFITHLRSQYASSGGLIGGATLRLRQGHYYSSGTWNVPFQLRIVGAGPSYSAQVTQIVFASRVKGIVIQRAGDSPGDPGGDGTQLQYFTVTGGNAGSDGTCNVSGATVTRVSGTSFTSRYLNGCTITLNGFDYPIASVTDGDHLVLGAVDMLVDVGSTPVYPSGTGGVGRLTEFQFSPDLVGATIYLLGATGPTGPAHTVDAVHDIGNLHVTPDFGFTSAAYVEMSGWAGTQTGISYVINDKHGVEVHARAYIEGMTANVFAGNGFFLDSSAGTGSNLNLTYIGRTRSANNHGNGFFFHGNDANAGNMIGIDASDNLGFGVFDISFLGNDYYGPHTIGNYFGSYHIGNDGNNHSQFYGTYQEDDQFGFYGNSGVGVWGGTINGFHPQSAHSSWGSVSTGNFAAGKIFTGVGGGGLYSSGSNGAIAATQREMVVDGGTAIVLGSAAAEAGYPTGYSTVLAGGYIGINAGTEVAVSGPAHFLTDPVYADKNIAWRSGTGDPTTTDIPSGTWVLWKNTTSGLTRIWVNDSGVLKSVTLS